MANCMYYEDRGVQHGRTQCTLKFQCFLGFFKASLLGQGYLFLLGQGYRFLSQVRDIDLASVSTMYRLVWNCSDSLILFCFSFYLHLSSFYFFCEKTNIQHVISTLRKSYFHQQFVLSSTVRTNTLRLCFLKIHITTLYSLQIRGMENI